MTKTWKVTLDEEELKSLINHHTQRHQDYNMDEAEFSTERSARIHDLTKRLNKKDEPLIETEVQTNDTQTQDKEGW